MNAYFSYIWNNAPVATKVLTPPMAQGAYAEANNTGANGINNSDPTQWCDPLYLEDFVSTGYGRMRNVYESKNDGIGWHNYWRQGFEQYGLCSNYAQHVSYYFPGWLQNVLDSGSRAGVITEADLFSYGNPPYQAPNQTLVSKDYSATATSNSLRKFIFTESRASSVIVWLLNDNFNGPDDHGWHEAYQDQGGYMRAWFVTWWPSPEWWSTHLPIIIR